MQVDIDLIVPSKTNPRKYFDQKAMNELVSSVKEKGVLMPVLIRPIEDDSIRAEYEIVSGERRYRAAKEAGLDSIPVIVRVLSNEEVLEIQIIENLQRSDLHPIEEAEGYEQLIKYAAQNESRLLTPEDIAGKVGKSVSYIYGRLKLCELTEEARAVFYDGKMTASVAELVARIPKELQKDALVWIESKFIDENPVAFRVAKSYIHYNFTLSLKAAGFDTKDAELVKEAGPCSTCPKRSGNQPELFGDIKNTDVCTDPSCFRSKREADYVNKTQRCHDMGYQIMGLTESRQIFKDGQLSPVSGRDYVDLKAKCEDDPRVPKRTYAQLLKGMGLEDQIAAYDDMGTIHLIVKKSIALSFMRKAGNDFKDDIPQDQTQRKHKTKEERKADKLQDLAKPRVFSGILSSVIEKSRKSAYQTKALRIFAQDLLTRVMTDAKKQYEKAESAIRDSFKLVAGRKIQTAIEQMTDQDIIALVLSLSVVHEFENSPAGIDPSQGPLVKHLCNFLDIDTKGIAKKAIEDVKAEEAAKNPPVDEKKSKNDSKKDPVKKKSEESIE